MMKIILVLTFLFSAVMHFGQSSEDWSLEFRKLYMDAHPELVNGLTDLFSSADSLKVTGDSNWLPRMESVTTDTTLSPNYYVLPFEMERHFYFQSTNKKGLAMNSLKICQSLLQNENAQGSLFKKTSEYLIHEFEIAGEYSFALISMKRLLEASDIAGMSANAMSESMQDSLQEVILAEKKQSATLHEKETATRTSLLQALAGAGLLLIILLVIFFMSRWSLKKKVKALIEKQKDTTELDSLAKRIEVLKSESQQFKHTAQLTINKLNGMDASGRKAASELQSLQSEILKSLEELRQQCEHNKASISPPVFMALQNVATRLGNTSTEKIQTISELLK